MTDSDLCLDAFNHLCDQLNTTALLSKEKCRYWVFERSYKAAVEELIANISVAAQSQGKIALEEIYLAKKLICIDLTKISA